MIRKYLLPLLATIGFLSAIYIVHASNHPVVVSKPVADPSSSPYSEFVAGSGIVEPEGEDVSVGVPEGGLVARVFVKVGDIVNPGAPLFQLDERTVRATLVTQKAVVDQAQARLQKLTDSPRPEDVPPVQAQLKAAEANLASLREQLEMRESLPDPRAISRDDVNTHRYAVANAEAQVEHVRAQLAELKAGTWKPDLEIAKTDLESAVAQYRATEVRLARLTVRAPIRGQCMQVKIHPGEYANAGPSTGAFMLLGNIDRLVVRVDVDEEDAWRVHSGAAASAFARGNRSIRRELTFKRFEPYVVAKKSLTNQSSERVDTRVLQVLYTFDRDSLPIYVGQQMDVYIEQKGAAGATQKGAVQ